MPILPRRFLCAVLPVAMALLSGLSASRVGAQVAPPTSEAATGSVSGIVFDSIGRKPLADAVVQLVNADSLSAPSRTVISDSIGRFLFTGLPRGRYLLGFLHPMLDTLGIEPTPRAFEADGTSAIRQDLAIPSSATLRSGICGADAVADGDALIIGFVRRVADRMAMDSATVNVQWIETIIERGNLSRSIATRAAATQESGWYAVCGAPSAGTVLLRAARGADSTEALELEVPADGFLRRDLYFGVARVVAGAEGPAVAGDSLALPSGVRRTGDGRLSGVVVSATGDAPVAGARVGLVDGPQTRSDAEGRFTLTSLPTGTRMLMVRAVGRYPVTLPVDVVDGAAPIRIAMATFQSVLDTVRVTAVRGGSRRLLEFNDRRKRSGTGRFITSQDVQARRPSIVTDLFRGLPGTSLIRDRNGDEYIAVRGNMGGQCRASIFLNGMSLRDMTANELNGSVQPADIIGIEVYTAVGAPAQFSEWNGCGSVVIWSR